MRLKKIIKELKGKITQDQAELPEWKKAWAQEWEVAPSESSKLNKQLDKRKFTFL